MPGAPPSPYQCWSAMLCECPLGTSWAALVPKPWMLLIHRMELSCVWADLLYSGFSKVLYSSFYPSPPMSALLVGDQLPQTVQPMQVRDLICTLTSLWPCRYWWIQETWIAPSPAHQCMQPIKCQPSVICMHGWGFSVIPHETQYCGVQHMSGSALCNAWYTLHLVV